MVSNLLTSTNMHMGINGAHIDTLGINGAHIDTLGINGAHIDTLGIYGAVTRLEVACT